MDKKLFNLDSELALELAYDGSLIIKSKETDGVSAVGFTFNTLNALTTDGSKILSIKNSGDECLNVRRGTSWLGNSANLVEFCEPSGDTMIQFASGIFDDSAILFKEGAGVEFIAADDYTYSTGYSSGCVFYPDQSTIVCFDNANGIGSQHIQYPEQQILVSENFSSNTSGFMIIDTETLDIKLGTEIGGGNPTQTLLFDSTKCEFAYGSGLTAKKWTFIENTLDFKMPSGGLINGRSINEYTAKWITYRKAEADVAAGDFLSELSIGINPESEEMIPKTVYFIPENALSANDTNYAILCVYTRPIAGGPPTLIASVNTKTVGEGGTGNWSTFVPISIPLEAPTVNVSSLGSLTFRISKEGSGVVVPAGTLQIEVYSKVFGNAIGV